MPARLSTTHTVCGDKDYSSEKNLPYVRCAFGLPVCMWGLRLFCLREARLTALSTVAGLWGAVCTVAECESASRVSHRYQQSPELKFGPPSINVRRSYGVELRTRNQACPRLSVQCM